MQDYEKVKKFVKNYNGMLTSTDFKNNEISYFFVNKLIDDHIIERVDKGIYNKADEFEDVYFVIQKKYTKAIFSYNTALYFLGKTEVTPNRIDITIPYYCNYKNINKKYITHYVKRDLINLGTTKVTTPFGNEVVCYNLERTICDIVRDENSGLNTEQTNKIIRNAFLKKQIDSVLLMEYAKELKCVKKIENLTEVLS